MAPIFTTCTGDAIDASADALIIPVYAGEAVLAALDSRLNGQLAATLASAGFGGKPGDIAAFATARPAPRALAHPRLPSASAAATMSASGAAMARRRDAPANRAQIQHRGGAPRRSGCHGGQRGGRGIARRINAS
ncbi:MAG: hypothetical protein U0232_12490 [Thermomicrobiales bacterium]